MKIRYGFKVKVKYCNRLSHALENEGLTMNSTLKDLEQVLKNKINTRAEIDKLYWSILEIIEPPRCKMNHCEFHTAFGMCGCAEHRIPSKCNIHKDFLARQKKRELKAFDDCLAMLRESEKCANNSEDENKKILTDAAARLGISFVELKTRINKEL
ncbi:MAG: hypothetical protein QM642_01935 [Edaphocola sp.]